MASMITGSLAYDTILAHNGRFAEKLEKGDLTHVNLTFLAPHMHRDFGGCAGNIAYALHLLGGTPYVWSALGRDGEEYAAHFAGLGIDTDGMPRFPDCYTSQAFIVTDENGCQLASFHPGAMEVSDAIPWPEHRTITYAILSPGARIPMQKQAAMMTAHGVPYLFDPGQAGPLFSADELRALAEGADACAFSDFEAEYLEHVTGLTPERLAEMGKTVYQTHGENGSTVWLPDGTAVRIEALPCEAVDPVGAGDAYRGGLLRARELGLSPVEGARIGTILGSLKVRVRGAQNYRTTLDDVRTIYEEHWEKAPF